MSLLLGIFYFLVLVGILIFIHEGGHFLAAKLFKVKVEVFSIGMGPRIFGFMKGDTDYRISAVPIGGYVRMLGEDPTAEVDESEGSVAAMAPWKRIVIYAAGPAANLLFPFGLYFFLALGQSTVPPAEIGAVLDNSPAERAGLRTGDRVVAIDGAAIYSFNHMVEVIQRHPGRAIVLTVERDGRTLQVPVVPAPKHGPKYDLPMLRHLRDVKGQIGILGIYPDTIVGVDADSVAARAGLRTFDRVEAVDGQPVERLFDLEKALLSAGGREASGSFPFRRETVSDTSRPPARRPLLPCPSTVSRTCLTKRR